MCDFVRSCEKINSKSVLAENDKRSYNKYAHTHTNHEKIHQRDVWVGGYLISDEIRAKNKKESDVMWNYIYWNDYFYLLPTLPRASYINEIQFHRTGGKNPWSPSVFIRIVNRISVTFSRTFFFYRIWNELVDGTNNVTPTVDAIRIIIIIVVIWIVIKVQ